MNRTANYRNHWQDTTRGRHLVSSRRMTASAQWTCALLLHTLHPYARRSSNVPLLTTVRWHRSPLTHTLLLPINWVSWPGHKPGDDLFGKFAQRTIVGSWYYEGFVYYSLGTMWLQYDQQAHRHLDPSWRQNWHKLTSLASRSTSHAALLSTRNLSFMSRLL